MGVSGTESQPSWTGRSERWSGDVAGNWFMGPHELASSGAWVRLALVGAAFYAGLWAGEDYAHGCSAGLKPLEWGVAIGLPLLSAVAVLFVRSFWWSVPPVTVAIGLAAWLAQPYLDWVHGPDSPWPGLF